MANLTVTIDAEAARLEREVKRTESAIRSLDRELDKANRTADKFNQQLTAERARAADMLGKGLLAFGAAAVAGLGLATKAAVDWESAWAGVTKTVDASDAQLAQIESELRGLAKTLPATHGEIAAVAEAAGQLGVAADDVVGFTKVMVDLGETTNLTADEAAVSIAQLMNVMQTAPDQVDELGAALVALGNNGASTERDIIQMAARIAGAGAIVGLTESDVLGFANAIASVGVEVEAGGSSISRVITDIGKAVAQGSGDLAEFAQVAGMSAAEFSTAFRKDPAAAVASFVEGLGRINKAGGDVFTVLDGLSLSEIRVSRTLLSLASAGDLLRNSLELGAKAWDENTALVEEAEKRYDTAAARIQIAKNNLVDFAIDIGNVLLPALAGMADAAADVFGFFQSLPGPVKTAVTILGGLAAVVALVGGGFLLLAPRILAAHQAMQLLAASAPRAAAGLGMVTRAAGIVAVLSAVAGAVFAIGQASDDTGPAVGEMTRALLKLQSAGDASELRDLIGVTEEAAVRMTRFGVTAEEAAKAIALSDGNVESLDSALASLVSGGNADRAAASLQAYADEIGVSSTELERLITERLPQYRDALAQVDVAQQIAGDSAEAATEQLEIIAAQFGHVGEKAAEEASKMLEAWGKASAEFFSLADAYEAVLDAKTEAEKEAAQATADATASSSDSWEDYVGDVDVTFEEYKVKLQEMVAAQENWATNMAILSARVPAEMLDHLAQLGPGAAQLVQDLADLTDAELQEIVDLFMRSGRLAGEEMQAELAASGPLLTEIARSNGQHAVRAVIDEWVRGGGSMFDAAVRLGIRADQGIDRGLQPRRTRLVPIAGRLDFVSLANVERRLNFLARSRTATIDVETGRVSGTGLTRQHGGKIPGPRSQAIGVTAHGGEWVVNPRASAFYGDDMLRAINEMRYVPMAGMTMTAGNSPGSIGPVGVRVFIGDREIHDIVRVEVDTQNRATARSADLYARAG